MTLLGKESPKFVEEEIIKHESFQARYGRIANWRVHATVYNLNKGNLGHPKTERPEAKIKV